MKITALYSRVSTDRQEKGFEAQKRALEEYCLKNGIKDYIYFQDENISGAKSTRPGLDQMMAAVRENRISMVIVYSFSRFARSTKHLLEALEEFKRCEVSFTSLTENINTNSPIGLAFFTIIGALAQLERELIGERVKNGMKNAKAKGKQIGRPKKVKRRFIQILFEEHKRTPAQIAKTLECSKSTVLRGLKELGLKR